MNNFQAIFWSTLETSRIGWSQDGLSGDVNEKLLGESRLEIDSGVPTELTEELGSGLALDSNLNITKIKEL